MQSNEQEVKQVQQAEFPIRVLDDIVVIDQVVVEKSGGGILLVGDEAKWPCGYVVAVGPGRIYSNFMDASGHQTIGQLIPTTVKVGDFAIFGRYQSGGEPIEWNGKKYLMCREGDLAGVSRDGKPVEIKRYVER